MPLGKFKKIKPPLSILQPLSWQKCKNLTLHITQVYGVKGSCLFVCLLIFKDLFEREREAHMPIPEQEDWAEGESFIPPP